MIIPKKKSAAILIIADIDVRLEARDSQAEVLTSSPSFSVVFLYF